MYRHFSSERSNTSGTAAPLGSTAKASTYYASRSSPTVWDHLHPRQLSPDFETFAIASNSSSSFCPGCKQPGPCGDFSGGKQPCQGCYTWAGG